MILHCLNKTELRALEKADPWLIFFHCAIFLFLSRYIFYCTDNVFGIIDILKKWRCYKSEAFQMVLHDSKYQLWVTPHTGFDSFTQYSFLLVTIRKGICVSGWNWTADLLCNPLHYTTTARWYCMTDQNLTIFFCVHNPTRVLETTGWKTTPNHYRAFTVFQKWL